MITWIMTTLVVLVAAYIMWLEARHTRRTNDDLAKTTEQIEAVKQSATRTYRIKYGKDPTGCHSAIDEVASAKRA